MFSSETWDQIYNIANLSYTNIAISMKLKD